MLAGRLLVGISSANLVRGLSGALSISQAPSRAYVAGATFKEERSGQLSLLSLFQVFDHNVSSQADLTLADHRLCAGPGHTSSCHPSWLQPGIFGGRAQVGKYLHLFSQPGHVHPHSHPGHVHPHSQPGHVQSHPHSQSGHVHPHRLDQRRCRLSQSRPFPARNISGFCFHPTSGEWEEPLKLSSRSFQCQR